MASSQITVDGEDRGSADSGVAHTDEERLLEAARGIVGSLATRVEEQIRLKLPIEERWLSDSRNYYGRYDPAIEEDLKKDAKSQAFVKLTRNKTNGWAARLSDILFPTDERNWGIEPTPLPKLAAAAKAAQEAAAASVAQANEMQDQADAAADPMLARQAENVAQQADAFAQKARQTDDEIAEAKKRAERMQEAIEDQLIESDYVAQCRDAIEDGCKLGTGIIKGPLTSNRVRQEWRPVDVQGQTVFALTQLPDPQPEFRRVDPWHFFPDMSARTIEEAEYTFERSMPTRRDLRKFAMKLGFNRDAVVRLLKDGPPIMGATVSHLATLREITGEGEAIKDRYIMWEYHGPLEGHEIRTLLRASSQNDAAEQLELEEDELREYRVIIYFCGNEVLKISPDYPLDSGDTLYSVWNFEKGETSVFGIGIPHIMEDSQRAVNAAWRMMMDNSGLSVGPQILMDKNALEPQDASYSLKANKVWLYNHSAMTQKNFPPFQVFNIPNNQAQLAGIIELGKAFADEETSLPMIAQGEQGAASHTLGGMSMLFNSANVVFRRVVKSFDDGLTKPTIRRAYEWNMQFNPDDSVKGDMQVDARGSSVLLVREMQSQNLMGIVTNWPNNPALAPYLKVRAGMVKTLQTMMIAPDDLLFTQEEADRKIKELQEMQAQAQVAPAATDPNQDPRVLAATIERDMRLDLADMERESRMMELAQRENISVEELANRLQIAREKFASEERKFATKVAVEGQREREGAARGLPSPETVGTGIG